MSFYIFRCKNRLCGKWSTKELKDLSKAKFRCNYCYKSFKVKLKNVLGLALLFRGPYGSGLHAASKCAELNARGRNV